jgi:hypothetical protein
MVKHLPIVLLALALARAQESPFDSTEHFFFRMTHSESSRATCVLVQEDGKFHLEQGHGKAVQVFEGTLSPDRLAALHSLLNDDRFLQLLPEAVSSSLLPTGFDETLISVPRDGRWMNLRFLSGMSSESNRPLLEKFMKWENGVLKGSHQKLREESSRNNCLPANQIELKTRPD